MSATTPILLFPYPQAASDPPNGAAQIQALAEAVEAAVARTITSAVPAADVVLGNDVWTDVCTLAAITVAGVARSIRLEAHAAFANTHVSQTATIALRILDTNLGTTVATSGKATVGANIAGNSDHADLVIGQTLSAAVGTHTYKLQAYRINGTVSVIKTDTLAAEVMASTRLAAVA